ncbi:MAG: hypothetical protein DRJ32_03630 [Thermoprotei archaeon]|nr:MAG: hypothetical protein DRJ32_03630 [Thermoprotei archaeon]
MIESMDLLGLVLSNPRVALSIVIQVLLGFALGYVSVKVVRYILAFLGLIVLGSVLSVWSVGGSVDAFLAQVSETALQLKPIILNLLTTLGILTVGPVTVGFVLGLIVGFLRK